MFDKKRKALIVFLIMFFGFIAFSDEQKPTISTYSITDISILKSRIYLKKTKSIAKRYERLLDEYESEIVSFSRLRRTYSGYQTHLAYLQRGIDIYTKVLNRHRSRLVHISRNGEANKNIARRANRLLSRLDFLDKRSKDLERILSDSQSKDPVGFNKYVKPKQMCNPFDSCNETIDLLNQKVSNIEQYIYINSKIKERIINNDEITDKELRSFIEFYNRIISSYQETKQKL